MKIRVAQQTEARAIAEVHVASWQGAYAGLLPDSFLSRISVDDRERTWTQILKDPDSDIFVAVDDGGTVVGFASLQKSRDSDALPSIGELTALYVEPNVWDGGYGRALLGAVIDKARQRGFHCTTLWVLESNVRARRFYEIAGFVADGAEKAETRSDNVVLQQVRYRLDHKEVI